MKKILLTVIACLISADLYAADKPDFSFSSFTSQLSAPAAALPEVPAPAAPAVRTGRYVQVSGYVTLNGNAFLPMQPLPIGNNPPPPPSPSYTSVTLNGWATFSDPSGQVTSGNVSISVPVSIWVYPNQYVSQYVNPNVYVQFSYKGRPAGSASMTGGIMVSGWPSGSSLSLSGSGSLSGSVYVED